MKRRLTLPLFVSLMVLCLVALGAPATAPVKPRTEADTLVEKLAGKDAAARGEAVERIREMIRTGPAQNIGNDLRMKYLPALARAERHEEIGELALAGILAQPANTPNVYGFQLARTRAILALGRKDEALACAKGLYNVAPMKDTADAMLTVAECLRAIDPALADRFREEQIAGASTRPATQKSATDYTDGTDKAKGNPSVESVKSVAPGEDHGRDARATNHGRGAHATSVLAGIKVDAAAYEEAIAAQTRESYDSYTALGNLLLLADRPKEAHTAFERGYALAVEKDLPAATENIARAIKAEDGAIGRANGWVLSLRQ